MTRLVLIFGGQSAEHDVSRATARNVLAAVDRDRYELLPIGITKDGRWVRADDALALVADTGAMPPALETVGPEIDPLPALVPHGDERVVVFPLLHGPLGEDGTVQGLLELADVAYVGSGVLGSALAMDKAKAKEVTAAAGIPQPRWRSFVEPELADRPAVGAALADELGFPMFVKPANMGSSVGVSKAADPAGLDAALDLALRYDEWVVVEEAVSPAREIEVSVLGNLELRVSVPGEIVPGADFYDFDDKYRDGAAELLIPAPLPDDVTAEVRELAARAYRALRAEGLARVDFFYEEGGRGLLLNEINTLPGFTPISMYPRLWEASGLPYAQLIDELVALAIERHERRRHRRGA